MCKVWLKLTSMDHPNLEHDRYSSPLCKTCRLIKYPSNLGFGDRDELSRGSDSNTRVFCIRNYHLKTWHLIMGQVKVCYSDFCDSDPNYIKIPTVYLINFVVDVKAGHVHSVALDHIDKLKWKIRHFNLRLQKEVVFYGANTVVK